MTTYLYLDTEFDSYRGELISLALVEPRSGKTFYQVRSVPPYAHPWVQANVLPLLEKEPVGDMLFRRMLWEFMRQWDRPCIVADWPEDLAHFSAHMCGENGVRPAVNYDMKLIDSGLLTPDKPHNALSDAMALADWCERERDAWLPTSPKDTINDLAARVRAANAKWWNDPVTGVPVVRNKGEMLMLIVSEVSEAMEGERSSLMDDKLPHRPMAEVELADVLIRVLDYAGGHGYDLGGAYVEKLKYNETRTDHTAAVRLAANGKKW